MTTILLDEEPSKPTIHFIFSEYTAYLYTRVARVVLKAWRQSDYLHSWLPAQLHVKGALRNYFLRAYKQTKRKFSLEELTRVLDVF